jgi:hypothetical protein
MSGLHLPVPNISERIKIFIQITLDGISRTVYIIALLRLNWTRKFIPMRKLKLMDRATAILDRVEFPSLEFDVGAKGTTVWLRVRCPQGRCTVSGKPFAWTGRKWILSRYMTDTEIVLTAFKALLTAYEHEARELFKVDGYAILDSHYSVDDMVNLARTAELDARK